MKHLFVFYFLAVSVQMLYGQAEDYRKIREEVFGWDIPAFKQYETPDSLSGESVVILARHNRITAGDMKGTTSKVYYTDTDRILLKINDKAALDAFSELVFVGNTKGQGMLRASRLTTVVGARVIKPDGSIRDIDSGDAVQVTEGQKREESYSKLAVADLEIGDLLDYFFQYRMVAERENIPYMTFSFRDTYPMLFYSLQLEVDPVYTVEYRPMNGAPDLSVVRNDAYSIQLYLEQKNLPKVEEVSWVLPFREYPLLRVAILNNNSKKIDKPVTARGPGVYKNLPSEQILNDVRSMAAKHATFLSLVAPVNKKVKKMAATYVSRHPGISKEALSDYLFELLYFYWPGEDPYTPEMFMISLERLMKGFGVEARLGFVPYRYMGSMPEIFCADDLAYVVTAHDNRRFYSYPDFYVGGTDTHPALAGEPVSTIAVHKYRPDKKQGMEGEVGMARMPEIHPNQMVNRCSLLVSCGKDPLRLGILRSHVIKGYWKGGYQEELLLFETWDKAMREKLEIEKSLFREISEEGKGAISDYRAFFLKQREQQKEVFLQEVSNYHGFSPVKVNVFEIKNTGVDKAQPEFEYLVQYGLDGLVKRAGDHLVFEVGKLIGPQFVVTDEERNRRADLYMPSVRTYEYQLLVEIPAGYNLGSFENLNFRVENQYASFISEAFMEFQGILTVSVKKIYHRDHIPIEAWPLLVEVLDAANDFYARSVVFQKTGINTVK